MTETAGIFSADLNINDNDELAIVIYEPVIGFTNSASSVNENGVSYDVEVSIEYPMGSDISVDYDVTAGTATGGGTDYTLASGTLTITSGDLSNTFPVALTDDGLPEGDETLEIT
ncbi:MAG: Calx-beta domain-containing protein, partial [Bacteroidales bacterium]